MSKAGDTIRGDLYVERETGVEVDLGIRGYSVGPVLHGYRANGTKAAPTAITAGQLIFGLGARPYTGTAWSPHSTAAIHMVATETHTSSAQGTDFRILVTPKGSTEAARKVALRVESTGQNAVTLFKTRLSGPLGERTYFQTDENASTSLGVLSPNGYASALNVFGASDPANSPYLQVWARAGDGEARLVSGATGSAAAMPIAVYVGAAKSMHLGTDGAVLAVSGPLGYGPGAGGSVTQATSKSTAVTLNKPCGQITMHNQSLAAGATAIFALYNSFAVTGTTAVATLRPVPGVALANYRMDIAGAGLNSNADPVIYFRVTNISASALADPLIIDFAIVRVSTS